MPTLDEVMSRSLVTVSPSATVAEAATVMSTNHVGSVLVCEETRLLGIFTERDVVRALASDFAAASEHVRTWMTPGPRTLGPSASTAEALELMLEGGFRHLPVVVEEDVVGIVSLRDLAPRS